MDEQQPQLLPPPEPALQDAGTRPPLREYLFRYNWADVVGLLAITLTVLSIVACVPGLNYVLYLLPIAALVLGIMALVQWRRAVDPQRTKVTGGISVGVAVLLLVVIVLCCCACAVFYGLTFAGSMAAGGSTSYGSGA